MKTAYSYGLNVRVGSSYFNHENAANNISYSEFNYTKNVSKTKKRGKRKTKSEQREYRSNICTEDSSVTLIDIMTTNTIYDTFIKTRKILFSQPKQFLKN